MGGAIVAAARRSDDRAGSTPSFRQLPVPACRVVVEISSFDGVAVASRRDARRGDARSPPRALGIARTRVHVAIAAFVADVGVRERPDRGPSRDRRGSAEVVRGLPRERQRLREPALRARDDASVRHRGRVVRRRRRAPREGGDRARERVHGPREGPSQKRVGDRERATRRRALQVRGRHDRAEDVRASARARQATRRGVRRERRGAERPQPRQGRRGRLRDRAEDRPRSSQREEVLGRGEKQEPGRVQAAAVDHVGREEQAPSTASYSRERAGGGDDREGDDASEAY